MSCAVTEADTDLLANLDNIRFARPGRVFCSINTSGVRVRIAATPIDADAYPPALTTRLGRNRRISDSARPIERTNSSDARARSTALWPRIPCISNNSYW